MPDMRNVAELRAIASMVVEELKYIDRATVLMLRDHNMHVISLLHDMDKKDRMKYFKEQAFPTYQEAEMIIDDKVEMIALIKGWKLKSLAMGSLEEARSYQQMQEIWETALSIWIGIRTACTNVFDVMWSLGIASVFPGEEHKKDSGALGMFGGSAKAFFDRLKNIKPTERDVTKPSRVSPAEQAQQQGGTSDK